MKKLIIIGASGHGKVVADIAKKSGYDEIAFLDDDENITTCGSYPVVGKSSDATNLETDIFIAIGNTSIRKRMIEELIKNRVNIITLIHPDAVIAEDVEIGLATVIMAGAVINPGSRIGVGSIINTGATVDHDCMIGDYVHVSVGAHIAGTVHIGDETWIGAGAVVSNNVNICGGCMIGAGAVVIKDIEEAGTYVGVPVTTPYRAHVREGGDFSLK